MSRNADFERQMKSNDTESTPMRTKTLAETNNLNREIKSVPKERPAKISPERGLPYRSANRANAKGLIHKEMIA